MFLKYPSSRDFQFSSVCETTTDPFEREVKQQQPGAPLGAQPQPLGEHILGSLCHGGWLCAFVCDCVFVRDRPLSQCKLRFISLACTSLVGMCTTRTTWFYTIKRGISEPPGPVGPVSREVRGAPPISCFVFLSDPCKIDSLCPEISGVFTSV